MPRQLTYEQTWAKNAQVVSGAGPTPAEDIYRCDEPDSNYTKRVLSVYLEGGEEPLNHIYDKADPPTRRMSSRAAGQFCLRHGAERDDLLRFARQHGDTVREALHAYSPRTVLPPPGSSSTSARGGHSSTTYRATGSAPATPASGTGHPPGCWCAACARRNGALADATGTMSQYSHLMATQGQRLHHAMADPRVGLDHASAATDDYTSLAYYVPESAGAAQRQANMSASERLEEDDDDEQRLPAYVMRRYSEHAGVREKTLSKVAGALAAADRAAVGLGSGSATHIAAPWRGPGPQPLDQLGDRHLSAAVAAMEVGGDVVGRRGSLEHRVLVQVSKRVADASARRAMAEVDADDSSEGQEEDLRQAVHHRSHVQLARQARAASAGGTGSSKHGNKRAGAGVGAGVHAARSALAKHLSAGGAVDIVAPRHVSYKLEERHTLPPGGADADADAARAVAATAALAAARRRQFREASAAARPAAAAEPRVSAIALSDSDEDDFAEQVRNLPASARQRRTTAAISQTLHSLGGGAAVPPSSPSTSSYAPAPAWAYAPAPSSASSASAGVRRQPSRPTIVVPPSFDASGEGEPAAAPLSARSRLADQWAQHTPDGRRRLAEQAAVARMRRASGEGAYAEDEVSSVMRGSVVSPAASVGSGARRRLLYDDEVVSVPEPEYVGESPRVPPSPAAAAALRSPASRLSVSEQRLLSAAGAASPRAATGRHSAMRTTWAPASAAEAAASGGAGAPLEAFSNLAARLSAPAAGFGALAPPASEPGRKDEEGWAERVYRSVSRPGSMF